MIKTSVAGGSPNDNETVAAWRCIVYRAKFLILAMMIACSTAAATDSAETDKQAAFRKLMQVTGCEAQNDQVMELFLSSMKKGLDSSIKEKLAEVVNDPEMREKASQIVSAGVANYLARFKAEYAKASPFSEMVDKVYYPAFAPNFSTEDILTLIRFYESDPGKRFVALSPQLMQQSASFVEEVYGPRMRELAVRLAKEELGAMKEKLEALKKKDGTGTEQASDPAAK